MISVKLQRFSVVLIDFIVNFELVNGGNPVRTCYSETRLDCFIIKLVIVYRWYENLPLEWNKIIPLPFFSQVNNIISIFSSRKKASPLPARVANHSLSMQCRRISAGRVDIPIGCSDRHCLQRIQNGGLTLERWKPPYQNRLQCRLIIAWDLVHFAYLRS